MAQIKHLWQSKTILLLVLPFTGADVVLHVHWWLGQSPAVAIWTLGVSAVLGLITLQMRVRPAPGAAAAGATITAGLMFSTVTFPYRPWQTALMPVVAVFVLASIATRLGRSQKKERLGTAESRQGRSAAQVAANLGFAALACSEFTQSWLTDAGLFLPAGLGPMPLFALGLAALAEAAADTVSSEVGQVFGGRPLMITTMREVEPGADGALSLVGTLAGVIASAVVAISGTLALSGGRAMFAVSCAGGIFGLFFDSLLGATLEQRGWLNNDAVNFLSTAGAAGFAAALLALMPHPIIR